MEIQCLADSLPLPNVRKLSYHKLELKRFKLQCATDVSIDIDPLKANDNKFLAHELKIVIVSSKFVSRK